VDGEPEVWDPYTGQTRRLYRFERLGGLTTLQLEMEPFQGVVVLFSPTSPGPEVLEDNLSSIAKIEETPQGVILLADCETGGDKKARLRIGGHELTLSGDADAPPTPISLNGPFSMKLEPIDLRLFRRGP
jgi:hypothetical protein